MSMGIENMTAEEVRGAQRLLLAMCGAAFVALAKTLFEVSAEVGVAPEEVPEEEPEDVPEEDGSDEGDEGDEEDGGDEEYEEDKPEEKRRWRLITDEEILDWVEKRDEGMPVAEIARAAGRGISVVSRKLKEYDQAQMDAAQDAEDAEDEEEPEDEEE